MPHVTTGFVLPQKKIGRNSPCWCGSGKKYKYCHLNRDTQSPLPVSTVRKEFKRAFTEKMCLAPASWSENCAGDISNAHTVPKSGSLRKIARKGHVYSIPLDLPLNREKDRSGFALKLQGLKKASTFSGFCARHDDAIFGPLEKRRFEGTPQQCFLLGYRAMAREFYTKQAAVKNLELLQDLDRGRSLDEQLFLQSFKTKFGTGLKTGFRDLQKNKETCDSMLERNHFGDVRSYIIEFESPPPVMCSGSVLPEQDFEGNVLQDLRDLDRTMDTLYCTSFFGGSRGVVAFTWLLDSDRSCRSFIESLMAIPEDLVSAALLRFFFEHFENLHISPEWWDGLNKYKQTALLNRFTDSVSLNNERRSGALEDDGVCFDPWTVVTRCSLQTGK